ncbi:MAG: DCC1-like thiol-disulfide oxidoreductase family protein [Bacteroidota bacterium]
MQEKDLYTAKSIILFDGFCNLCSWAVQFVVKRDKKKKFQFASLQSEYGIKILIENNLPASDFNSLVLVENGKIYTQSTGALKIARSLSGLWPIFYTAIILPTFIRDGIYNWVAKNRYKWFGRKEACFLLNDDTLFIDK